MKRGGGIITRQDLADYPPVWRAPLAGTYRGYTLLAMPPSSSGGITMLETLNILERFPAAARGERACYHLLAEAFRRAFIDRNTKLGDPAFVKMPVDAAHEQGVRAQQASRRDRPEPRLDAPAHSPRCRRRA